MTERTRPTQLLSIGALARAIGIPVETLRTWERRYGVPAAERTESGHRRYPMDTLQKLRLVRAAIQAGHRASAVVPASEEELRELMLSAPEVSPPPEAAATDTSETESQHAASVSRCIEHLRRFDGRAFDRELTSGLAALGALPFMERRIKPLLLDIGMRWSTGDLGVRHEHFASERLQEFLARHWQPLSDAATGPVAVCATPVGEHHTLGLHLAAYTLALNNVRVVYLGADLPADELANAVQQHAARVALMSAASGKDAEQLRQHCVTLRDTLGAEVTIIVGGSGFVEASTPGTLEMQSLRALSDWARAFTLGFSPN
jgi:DNA-binding transcriptional MerR regulator/methylmalonyl-CoA mutase cobalamin-binding subunit